MSNASEFIIENGVLTKYKGKVGDVVIPDGVKEIGERTFHGRRSLVSVVIPDGVEKIGDGAFNDCASLTSIVIPDSVKIIGDYAFYGCESLTSVVIPDGVTSIGEDVFSYCSNLTSVTIPDGVTSIGGGAFDHCKSLTNITIPNNVTEIYDAAFFYCENLKSVTIPESVTRIGNEAFRYCEGLTNVIISDGVTEIGEYAFRGCKKLTCITIPKSVTTILPNAFPFCTIEVSADNPAFSSENGILYGKDHTKLVFCWERDPGYFTVPDGVTEICEEAFGSTNITGITIPPSVTKIGMNAFYCCERLTDITAPEEIFAEVWELFQPDQRNEVALNSLRKGVTNRPLKELIRRKKEMFFDRVIAIDDACAMETFISVFRKPDVGTVDEYLKKAENRVNVKAFLLDYKAKHFSASELGEYYDDRTEKELGFKEKTLAEWRKIFKISDKDGKRYITGYKSSEKTVFIPANIEGVPVFGIGDKAFEDLWVESVNIERGIKSIGSDTFFGCSNLTSVTVPDSVTSIGHTAFYNCAKLTSVTVPGGVTNIGLMAFFGCAGLTDVTIGSGVTSIGSGAFEGCTSLTSVTIPDGATSMGSSVFNGCANLKDVTIPGSVTSIGILAFSGCPNLTISAAPGSYAEEYAKKNNIPFKAV